MYLSGILNEVLEISNRTAIILRNETHLDDFTIKGVTIGDGGIFDTFYIIINIIFCLTKWEKTMKQLEINNSYRS